MAAPLYRFKRVRLGYKHGAQRRRANPWLLTRQPPSPASHQQPGARPLGGEAPFACVLAPPTLGRSRKREGRLSAPSRHGIERRRRAGVNEPTASAAYVSSFMNARIGGQTRLRFSVRGPLVNLGPERRGC